MDAWGKELVVELYTRYAPDVERLQRFDAFIPTIGKSYAGEERRLLYVGMTRAKKHLRLTFAQSRFLWGERQTNAPSRFLDDLPPAYPPVFGE